MDISIIHSLHQVLLLFQDLLQLLKFLWLLAEGEAAAAVVLVAQED
jgi:hypothetical protein